APCRDAGESHSERGCGRARCRRLCRHASVRMILDRTSTSRRVRPVRPKSHTQKQPIPSRMNGVRSCFVMIWFFDRDGERLRYEIKRARAEGRYRVVITQPDGTESVEEVKEPTELIERSVQLMNALRNDGWKVA